MGTIWGHWGKGPCTWALTAWEKNRKDWSKCKARYLNADKGLSAQCPLVDSPHVGHRTIRATSSKETSEGIKEKRHRETSRFTPKVLCKKVAPDPVSDPQ